MEVTFLGHAAVSITTKSHTILIDPFLTGNALASVRADEVKADAILVTHGHSDHLGDTVAIAKRTGALVVACAELAGWLKQQGVSVHAMHLGGSHEFPFGWVKFTLAFHGAGIDTPQGTVYGGNPVGILFRSDGKTIYHAGDTALFSDMRLIGQRHLLDLAMLPIGDNYTMGPDDALYAAELLAPKAVMPMHYDTFELIHQDAHAFVEQVRAKGIQAYEVKPGESVEI